MKSILTAALLLLLFSVCTAQNEVQQFEPGLISNDGAFGLTLSPDSKTALWVDSKGKRDTLCIMESRKIKGKWQPPTVASFSTSKGLWKDIDPIFSPDGKTVLFQSNRYVESMPNRRGFDIWAVDKLKHGWSRPYHLGNKINSDASESYASMAKNGSIYFMKENEKEEGNSDIYVSHLVNGEYQAPERLDLPINTAERESNPFISPNENYLIYFSSNPKGFGDVDLYISFKHKNKWSSPKNLYRPINSELAEFCPFVHKKEKRLYFSRQFKKNNRMIENIYYVPFNSDDYGKNE